MTPSKDLFELVKSMSSAEKGYVKKRALVFKVNAQNLQLLELIDKQDEYDEALILKKLKTFNKNKFAVAKNYLYTFILECLENYNQTNVKNEIRSLLNKVEILNHKGLDHQTIKLVKRAKQLAEQYQLYNYLAEISDWEVLGLMEKKQTPELFKEIEALYQQTEDTLLNLESAVKSKSFFTLSRQKYLNSGFARTKNSIKELEDVFRRTAKNVSGSPDNFISNFYFLLANANFNFMNSRFREAYQYILKLESYWEKFPKMKETYVTLYINYLIRKVLFEERLHLVTNVFKTLDVTMSFINSHEVDKKHLSIVYVLKLGMHNQFADYKGSLDILNKIFAFRKTLIGKKFIESEEQLFIVTAADYYYEIGDLKKANQYINEIINSKIEYRDDIYCFSHVKSIVVHYDMNNKDLLDYKINTTIKFLKSRKRLHKTEELVLKFIKAHLSKVPSVKDYRSLKDQVEKLIKSPLEKNVLNYFNFLIWIDSKMEGKRFEEVKKKQLMP